MKIGLSNNFSYSFGSKRTFKREFETCAYSGEKFEQCDCATVEHIIPAVRGGKDDYSNYLVVKRRWNMDRGDTPLGEYIRENPSIRQNIVDTVNSKQGEIIEGINWSKAVKKTLRNAIGYDIFK